MIFYYSLLYYCAKCLLLSYCAIVLYHSIVQLPYDTLLCPYNDVQLPSTIEQLPFAMLFSLLSCYPFVRFTFDILSCESPFPFTILLCNCPLVLTCQIYHMTTVGFWICAIITRVMINQNWRNMRHEDREPTLQTVDEESVTQLIPPPPPPPLQVDRKIVKLFLEQKPPVFDGTGEPAKAETWIRALEWIFTILICNDRERLICVTYQLTGSADFWWDTSMKSSTPTAVVTAQPAHMENKCRAEYLMYSVNKCQNNFIKTVMSYRHWVTSGF